MLHKHAWSHSNRDSYLAVDKSVLSNEEKQGPLFMGRDKTFKIKNKIILDMRSAMIITKQSDMIEGDLQHGLKWASL